MLNIIHLPEREDRYATLMKELEEQKITDFKIWEGVRSSFPFLGIKRAHQNIVRDAKLNSLPYVIVCEDDVKFFDKGAYEYFLAQMPPLDSFDIYLAGIMLSGELNPDNSVKDGYFTGFTLYIMSAKFYDTFLSIRGAGNIDAMLRGLGRYVVCDPMIVSQHGGYSDNNLKIVKSYDEIFKDRNIWRKG